MKKILTVLAAIFLAASATGQGYWSNMIVSSLGNFPENAAAINAILYRNNTIYYAGNLSQPTGATGNNVFNYNGNGTMLGSNVTCLNADGLIWTLCSDAPGNIYTAGAIDGGDPGFDVMKWNGAVWSKVGGATPLAANGYVFSICSDAAGNIYAAGSFRNGSNNYYVSRWNGTNWAELGGVNALAANASIRSITADAAGNIYAAGYFTNASGKCYVAKWNGTAWSEVGGANALAANSYLEKVYTDAAGKVYAAGNFTNAAGHRYVALWNGNNWTEMGTGSNALQANGIIRTLTGDIFGNIYAAGTFTNATQRFYVAKWNGTTWSETGAGAGALNANNLIMSLASDAQGRIYAAGNFEDSNRKVYVARYSGGIPLDSLRVSVVNNAPAQINTLGGSLQLISRIYPLLSDQSVTWSSSPAGVAGVSTMGNVTAIADGQVWVKATSVENPALRDSVKITITGQSTGIFETALSTKGISVYPVPATQQLFIHIALPHPAGMLRVYDSKGSVVLSASVQSSAYALDIRSLRAGVYTLQYVAGGEKVSLNFVKA